MNRRQFLGTAAGSLAGGLAKPLLADSDKPRATADSVIFIWLAGGMCHLDTFDPKQVIGDGANQPGSYYKSIPTASPNIRLCEHLPRIAERMDRTGLIRTMTHSFSNHTAAVNFTHTGRPPTGTLIYPSLGSITSKMAGPREERVPPYVVLGQPMVPRGPGFLGGKHGYVYVLNTEEGPAGLTPPYGRSVADLKRREKMLRAFSREFHEQRASDALVEDYEDVTRQAFGMVNEEFLNFFNVRSEPTSLKEQYGDEFGQRCLLSRKLVQGGVRFVECSFNLFFINGYGWDAHAFAQKRLHLVIDELDRGVSALLDDLERTKLLDRTLVVVATEFGRPPEFDGQGGRGHQSAAYSVLLAGGGVRGGTAVGRTDDLGREVVDRPVKMADLHATILHALGLDPAHHFITPTNRPVPVTDFGEPVMELFT